jgi:hypothetical protein
VHDLFYMCKACYYWNLHNYFINTTCVHVSEVINILLGNVQHLLQLLYVRSIFLCTTFLMCMMLVIVGFCELLHQVNLCVCSRNHWHLTNKCLTFVVIFWCEVYNLDSGLWWTSTPRTNIVVHMCCNPSLALMTKAKGLTRLQAKKKARSHIACSRKCRKVWGNEPSHSKGNSHFGK